MNEEREPLIGSLSHSYGGQRVDVLVNGQTRIREKSISSVTSAPELEDDATENDVAGSVTIPHSDEVSPMDIYCTNNV